MKRESVPSASKSLHFLENGFVVIAEPGGNWEGGGGDEEGECALCLQILNFMPQWTKKLLC